MKPIPPDVMLVKESRCLECGALMNAIGTADPNKPASIDPETFALCVCIKCGAVMTLAPDLTLRGMTEEEMDGLLRDDESMNELARMVRNVHLFRISQS
jgi:hypothetical protein